MSLSNKAVTELTGRLGKGPGQEVALALNICLGMYEEFQAVCEIVKKLSDRVQELERCKHFHGEINPEDLDELDMSFPTPKNGFVEITEDDLDGEDDTEVDE